MDKPEVFRNMLLENGGWDEFQVRGMLASYNKEVPKAEKNSIADRTQIADAKYNSQIEYLYRIMSEEYHKDKLMFVDFLRKLLELPLDKRKKLAEFDSNQGIMAELSFYIPPACFVNIYALLEKKEFWAVWDALGIKGYSDMLQEEEEQSDKPEKWEKCDFYKQILRENQDEFLEFWDGRNLVLSDQMDRRIRLWKQIFVKTEDRKQLPVEEYLADTLLDMMRDWPCRYVDHAFVDGILSHKNDSMWRRALLVLRRIMDDGLELFPELDRSMAVRWVKTYRPAFDIKAIYAYCSLMENEGQRYRIFGF